MEIAARFNLQQSGQNRLAGTMQTSVSVFMLNISGIEPRYLLPDPKQAAWMMLFS